MPTLSLVDESRKLGNFYVPRFEIVVGGTKLPDVVLRDVTRITYSDDIKKLDNFELTVNNWDMQAQEFKYVGAETLETLDDQDQSNKKQEGRKQQFNPLHRLFEPCRHRVEILMGYGGDLKRMLTGSFTTMEPTFPSSGASTLTVRGLNVLHRLRTKQRTYAWPGKTESQIAESFESRLPDPDNNGKKLKILTAPLPTEVPLDYIAQNNQYDIDFLFELARRAGYVLFIQEKEEKGGKVIKERGLYFGPSTGSHPALRTDVLELKWGTSLIDFKPTLTTANQIKSVTVNGWNVATKKKFVGRASIEDEKVNKDLHLLLEKCDAREEQVVDLAVCNQKDADKRARAILQGRAKDLVKANGTCVGLPELRAGQRVVISNLGARFNGEYFVTDTTHTLDDKGYFTKFNARREEKKAGDKK